jgi:hypothetical protein
LEGVSLSGGFDVAIPDLGFFVGFVYQTLKLIALQTAAPILIDT